MRIPLALLLCVSFCAPARTQESATTEVDEAIEIGATRAEAERALERATAAQEAGDVATARREVELVVELLAPLPLGEGNDDTAAVLQSAGLVAYRTGHPAVAREAWSRLVDHCERIYAEDHPDLLTSRSNLASAMKAMGDLAGARALQEVVLAGLERIYTEDHPNLLTARSNLATTMSELGDLPGARALQEAVLGTSERIYTEDHPNLLTARGNLALTMRAMGDLAGSRALLEAVLAAGERIYTEDHPHLLAARNNLAVTILAMGNLPGARALLEAVLATSERIYPEDHPELLTSRNNLASAMKAMGDLAGARALEEAVLAARERILPADHPDLLTSRNNLAATLEAMGDLPGARALQEAVLATSERIYSEDHPDLITTRNNLAGMIKAMGDLAGARALQEAVLAASERIYTEDHPDLITARGNLALTMLAMGDLPGARALQEAVLTGCERIYPQDHPDLLVAHGNLAGTMQKMGDLPGARALQEAVLAGCERIYPEDHPELLTARGNLAGTIQKMGDLPGARALLEAVLAGYERTLPEDHPKLLTTCGNLALMLWQMGDLPGAHALQESVLAACERIFPADHPDLLTARCNLALMMWQMGDVDVALGHDVARGMLRHLELASTLSPREAREAAAAGASVHSTVRFLTDAQGSEPESFRFDLAETLRATSVRSNVAAMAEDDPRRGELSGVRARLNDLVSGGARTGQSSEAFAAKVAKLTFERDRLEREVRGELAARGLFASAVRADEVARALPKNSAAVGFLRIEKLHLDPQSSRVHSDSDVLAAHVLSADGSLTEFELGAADELAELARAWRAALGKPIERGVTVEKGHVDRERAAGEALRARVLDPIFAALGDGVTTLHVCLDDFLHLVPIGALPLGPEDDEGKGLRVRDRFEIVNEVSFVRLLSEPGPLASENGLLAVGGVKFDAKLDDGASVEAAATRGDRSARPESFAPLRQTRFEAESIWAMFEEEFGEEEVSGDAAAVLLTRAEATKAAFHEQAPGKRYLHIATHGWFAPETVRSTLDAQPGDEALWSRLGAGDTVTGLAPMTLCGLAFAGANQGRNSLGRVPGILTAEELAGIDLSSCELAVLSACETNVGIRRAGQGVQSLQAALHAAGARTAITSLWKVDDAETRQLMELFYTYLWVDELPKADALWKAQCDLRYEGAAVRDWAGWVLSGDPR